MITAFLLKYWEFIVIGFLLLNLVIQKIEKIKGNSDILTGVWKLLVWIKSLIGSLITAVFSTKPGKLPMIFLTLLLSSFLVVGMGVTDEIATFQWDSNTEPDLAGYRIYISDQSGVYNYGPTSPDLLVTVPAGSGIGGVEEIIVAIPDGTYWFVATAFDTEGLESDPSNEITDTFNGPPGCPKVFRFKT